MKKPLEEAVFFDYFDAKYLINLPERKDRLRRVRKQFEKHSLSFNEISLFESVKCPEADGFPSTGARGCFLSHLGVLKDAKTRGAEKILIMEDDLGLCRDLFVLQKNVVQELKNKKWDMAYLGNKIPRDIKPAAPGEILLVLPAPVRLRGSHFYAIHGRTVPRMISFLEAMLDRPSGSREGGPMHFDGALGWFRRNNGDVITLASRPVLGVQSSTESDIHKKSLDAVALLSCFLRPIRKIKNIIKYGC